MDGDIPNLLFGVNIRLGRHGVVTDIYGVHELDDLQIFRDESQGVTKVVGIDERFPQSELGEEEEGIQLHFKHLLWSICSVENTWPFRVPGR